MVPLTIVYVVIVVVGSNLEGGDEVKSIKVEPPQIKVPSGKLELE